MKQQRKLERKCKNYSKKCMRKSRTVSTTSLNEFKLFEYFFHTANQNENVLNRKIDLSLEKC